MVDKLPFRFLDIGPHRYKVVVNLKRLEEIEESEGTRLFGAIIMGEFQIILRPGMPASQLRETLLHEICHVVYDRYIVISGPQEGWEEPIVSSFSFALTEVFQRNKAFARWFVS